MEVGEAGAAAPRRDEIAIQIMLAADTHAASRGFRLGEGADAYFHDVADRVADELVAADAGPLALAEGIGTATRNFRAMIDAMIDARGQAYADDPARLATDIIGEATLGRALSDLCPIWPFCE